jgi:hypothetical protein
MSLAIIIAATSSFQYALRAQARAIRQNVGLAGLSSGHIILVTDEKPVAGLLELYRSILGGFEIHHLALDVKERPQKDYTRNSQLLIAQLYSAGFDKARLLGVDQVWTLEADVIPEANNLRCMRDMLNFDGGYYDVAFCPYLSAGGGAVMGGRGDSRTWIYPNEYEDERDLPDELKAKLKDHRDKLQGQPSQAWIDEMRKLEEEARQCPPKFGGNVFKLNGERWRKRGWLESAYPGVGKGAIVPSDWFPQGNNLYSRRAINLVDYTGYVGNGTQDLWLCHFRLAPNGLKFCVIPHAVSHHVSRKKNADGGEFTMYYLYHEDQGDAVGHLRRREMPFYSHEPGESVAPPANGP